MNTTARGSSQEKNVAGQRHTSLYSEAKCGVTPGRRADHVNKPFPNKAVCHKRPFKPTSCNSLELNDFEKVSISKKPGAPSSSQEHMSNSISRKTTGSRQPNKDSLRQPNGELQMAKEIHLKKLVLQEKLWKVEEKIRQKIQLDGVGAAASHGQNSEEEGKDCRGQAETETRQRKEPERHREMMIQGKEQEVKQRRKKQDQRKEDRMKMRHGEQEAKWDRREIKAGESTQLQIKGNKGAHKGTFHEERVREELKRGKEEVEEDNSVWEKNMRSKQGKAKDREQNKISKVDEVWSREKNYNERTDKEVHSSRNDDDSEGVTPQMSQEKTARGLATEDHRAAERKVTEGPSLPQASSPSRSSRQQQGEPGLIESTDGDLQLRPCRICNRTFWDQRLERHVQVCEKMKQSQRQVFNSYNNRTKGSAIEDYFKTHSRSKTPEVLKKNNKRQNMKTQHQTQHAAGSSKLKWSK